MTLEEAREAELEAQARVTAIEVDADSAAHAAKKAHLKAHGYEDAIEALIAARRARIAAEDAQPALEWEGRRVWRIESKWRGWGMPVRKTRVEGVVDV